MIYQKPRILIAGLRGGTGKTVVSVGLVAAWRLGRGRRVVAFKKGPDYIDSGWLGKAAAAPCYNLDPFLMSPDEILASFVKRSWDSDGCVIEGNRGLYDGVDVEGTCSTAELAKLLKAPVVLVVDASKVTRTVAALVLGCQNMDPDVKIAGVILNRVGGRRHERLLRDSITRYCGVRIFGSIPKDAWNWFPERHMGLIPPEEHCSIESAIAFAAQKMRDYVDLDLLWEVAEGAEPLGWPVAASETGAASAAGERVTIGVIRDSAFQFYYPENLEALESSGATLLEISSLTARKLPELDALYIGGGFPETHLEPLHRNRSFRESLRSAIESGLPVYAECGGLMFLCRGIHSRDGYYPMVGVFPCEVKLLEKPQGHGYVVAECVRNNPFIPKGIIYRGHEFHYSAIVNLDPDIPLILRLRKGHGILNSQDGICYKNAFGLYSHIHAVGNNFWPEAMVRAARIFRGQRLKGESQFRNNVKPVQAGIG